jgi:hypothetical protein
MAAIAQYVAAHPGCTAKAAASVVGPHGSLMYGYQSVHRAITAGLVWAIEGAGRYRLFPVRETAS